MKKRAAAKDFQYHYDKDMFKKFFEKFLKCADKKKVVEPPTYLEKALIVGRPIRRTPKKVILPEVVEKKKMKKKS